MSLVKPSTSLPISRPKSPSISSRVEFGILDRVVQHRRDDRRIVEPHIGENRGNLERMREIRIARGALLHAMCLHCIDIGAVEQFLVRLRIISPHAIDEFILPHHDCVGPRQKALDHDPVLAHALNRSF